MGWGLREFVLVGSWVESVFVFDGLFSFVVYYLVDFVRCLLNFIIMLVFESIGNIGNVFGVGVYIG